MCVYEREREREIEKREEREKRERERQTDRRTDGQADAVMTAPHALCIDHPAGNSFRARQRLSFNTV